MGLNIVRFVSVLFGEIAFGAGARLYLMMMTLLDYLLVTLESLQPIFSYIKAVLLVAIRVHS